MKLVEWLSKLRLPLRGNGMWKVPFRGCYTDTFRGLLLDILWCHFLVRFFPFAHDFRTDALCQFYVRDPVLLRDQLEHLMVQSQVGKHGFNPVPMTQLAQIASMSRSCAKLGISLEEVESTVQDAWRTETARSVLAE